MKQLKFKVWDTVKQKMLDPQGITFNKNSLSPFAVKVAGRPWEPAGKYEFIQCINLVDSKGTDVYEGDLIKIFSQLYKVTWNDEVAGFELIKLGDFSKRNISDVSLGNVSGNELQDACPA